MPKYDLIITDANADIDAARGVRLRSESKQPPVVVILNMTEPQRRKRSYKEVIEIPDSDDERDTAVRAATNSTRRKTAAGGPATVSSGKRAGPVCGPSNSAGTGGSTTAGQTASEGTGIAVAPAEGSNDRNPIQPEGSTQLTIDASSARTTDTASTTSTATLVANTTKVTTVGGEDTEPEIDVAEVQPPRKKRLRRASEARRERLRLYENAPSYIINPYEPLRGGSD
ncbi:hypothetical protein K474DRAFT_1668887, partial [Panus rudis PR-1116 ss-1]